MQINLRELAKRAGVSVGTVSRALKGQAGVSAALRETIMALAIEHNYQSERLQHSPIRHILLVLHRQHATGSARLFYDAIIAGAHAASLELGIQLSTLIPDPAGSLRRQIKTHAPDAILCLGYIEPPILQLIQGLGKPLVLIDNAVLGINAINPDNLAGARLAMQHLLVQGYQRIAFLSGSLAHYSIRQRERGYRQALFDANRLADPALEVLIPPELSLQQGAIAALDSLLALPKPPDALFCFNDICAVIVKEECLRRGIKIPVDLALIGFDDIAIAAHQDISTIAINKAALGRSAVLGLLSPQPSEVLQSVELIIRASS
ncbi:LacI family DNA-binding transcriptional regulator [Iodobacter arcticus]|uniref:LacI family DNA-binding transcriptional regulator n=1 Tax=Iodobacter arcticus TaxID=590593 RepID=A0ABW2R2D6_9NEIS